MEFLFAILFWAVLIFVLILGICIFTRVWKFFFKLLVAGIIILMLGILVSLF